MGGGGLYFVIKLVIRQGFLSLLAHFSVIWCCTRSFAPSASRWSILRSRSWVREGQVVQPLRLHVLQLRVCNLSRLLYVVVLLFPAEAGHFLGIPHSDLVSRSSCNTFVSVSGVFMLVPLASGSYMCDCRHVECPHELLCTHVCLKCLAIPM